MTATATRPVPWLSLVSSLWTAWVAWTLPVVLATAAPPDRQGAEPACSPTLCGGVNISFPFWIVADHATETSCGLIGFQVICSNNTTPYIGSYKTPYSFRILNIFYSNASLLVADVHKLGDFVNVNGSTSASASAPAPSKPCHSPTGNSSSKLGLPFSISPANQNMVFYDCVEPPAQAVRRSRGLVDTACGNRTLVGVARRPDVPGSYSLEGCHATVVPVLVRSGQANPANYEELIRDGFLLTWQLPLLPPPSPAGPKGRTSKVVGIVCGVVAVSLLAACFFFVWHKRKRRKQARAPNGFMHSESSLQSYSKDLELGGSPQIFTYEELEEATDGFSDSRELGDGGFGTVYKGKLQDGRVVAVKRLYKNNYKRVEQFKNEVDILSRLLHQNLVILYGCTSRSSRDLMLVYEFVPNGTVADHLHGSRASERDLTWPLRVNIAIETAEALAYLHAVEIIHRDVKTNNILLDNSFHVKVADFGLSRLCPPEVTHVSTVPQGTPGYVDPVYHQCYKLTEKSDVYSFGVVLVELISSKPAVDMSRTHSDINLANMALNRIQNHEVDRLVDPELGYETDDGTKKSIDLVMELAFQCLQLERDSRPSMKEVVVALNCIKNGDSPENKMDRSSSSPKEDAHLLTNSIQYSPDSVIHRFHSQSTTHSAASNASG
ncbi:LEAF RUST 10 DISEASE-RESISTANCE LOCUS RECEPTOR-LIKE PROTEIN KINASE-like 1.2 isoform 1 precursor [Zea mays]|uniref:non-specific serine/threonine protein kinase n=1 Tax=Zea mays TaxID=4577 RepID=C0PG23_MAIZE|nr:LEAF RUST 10 DISEASE-RESISTANCE LOCUS RECEPTOR-LIKE PROTEIN KINASE-like 1.2 isoform 1 precursor [Zea mays]ACN34139.1 unknown [Zea mays]